MKYLNFILNLKRIKTYWFSKLLQMIKVKNLIYDLPLNMEKRLRTEV